MSETTLPEFLIARIASDEAWIRNGRTHAVGHRRPCIYEGGYEGTSDCDCGAVERALADLQAKRRIVGVRADLNETTSLTDRLMLPSLRLVLDRVLEELALPYADHPDFDEAWRTHE